MENALFAATVALVAMSSAAQAQAQTLPLNTGYNHASLAVYAPGAQDQYWIKIESYEPPATAVPVAPAWVYAITPPWKAELSLPTMPAIRSRWIGPRASPTSSAGTSLNDPAYSIYRKCFSMKPGFQNGKISISILADDIVHVWLNDVNRTLVAPSLGQFLTTTPLTNSNSNPGLKAGRNCIYVLVQDIAGITGFNLAGTVSATGGAITPLLAANGSPPGVARDDSGVVRAIVAFAEARRAVAPARRAGGGAPAQ